MRRLIETYIFINIMQLAESIPRKGGTMKPTLLDVAELAKVSRTTACRAMNNEGRIDEETRKRVLEAAKTLNYQPNRLAQSLRVKQSFVIGVIFSNLFAGHFYSEIFRGIEEYTSGQNYNLILGCSDGSVEKETELIESFQARQVDGLIMTPTNHMTPEAIEILENSKIPVVFIDRCSADYEHDYVGTDNLLGGKLAADYLKQLGHRNIAVCMGPDAETMSVTDRLRGAVQVFEKEQMHYFTIMGKSKARNSKEFSYEAMLESMDMLKSNEATAVMAMSDSVALGASRALIEHGYRIGKDIALIGYNNDDFCPYLTVPLTTVGQPKYELGERAAELLLKKIRDKKSKCNTKIILKPKLVIRQSCGEF